MKVRMWEAVAAPGRLADLERAAGALRGDARGAGIRVEAATDGVERVVVTVRAEDPPPLDEAIPAELFTRAHAWTFTELALGP